MRELFFALLATRREFADAGKCRKQLVGPMRRYLAAHGDAKLLDWPGLPPHAAALVAERLDAAADLAEFCERCGRCETAKILR